MLDAVGGGPAYVFGHSGGALTTLALVERHPDRVRTAVLMEPPLVGLLPDAVHIRANDRLVTEAYERDGVWAAAAVFMAQAGSTRRARRRPQEWLAAMEANFDVFFGRMYRLDRRVQPDFAALRPRRPASRSASGPRPPVSWPTGRAIAFAERLGRPTVEFPGDHNGFTSDPEANAVVLRKLLS